jgi:hypothetical protein
MHHPYKSDRSDIKAALLPHGRRKSTVPFSQKFSQKGNDHNAKCGLIVFFISFPLLSLFAVIFLLNSTSPMEKPTSQNPARFHWNGKQWTKLEEASGIEEQASVRARIKSHVSSRAYKDRVDAIIKANTTGILIPAGGSQLITNALVTLKVVRHHLNSSLPIEIMWQSKDEMDSRSWDRIREEFKPIRGVDISSIPHPVPGLHSK